MLNGKQLAEYYLAYRHPQWARPANLTVFQHDEQSAVQFKVTAPDGAETMCETSAEAINCFRATVTV